MTHQAKVSLLESATGHHSLSKKGNRGLERPRNDTHGMNYHNVELFKYSIEEWRVLQEQVRDKLVSCAKGKQTQRTNTCGAALRQHRVV